MTFLPPGSDPVTGSNFYFRPEEGDNRVRCLAPPIVGWVGWTAARKPLRRPVDTAAPSIPTIDESEVVIDDKNVIRKFWALPIWDYAARRIKVWEIGQSTIQRAIKKLAESADWGDPRRFDLIVTRTTDSGNTSYTVMPAPKKRDEQPAIVAAWKEVVARGFDISRLFDGGDPFNPSRSNRPNGPSPTGFADETYFDAPPTGDDMPPADDAEPLPF